MAGGRVRFIGVRREQDAGSGPRLGGWVAALIGAMGVAMLLCAAVAMAQAPAPAASAAPTAPRLSAPAWRFRAATDPSPLRLGEQVLSEEERRFVAGLPELRVGLSLPPSRPYEVLAGNGEISGLHPELLMALGRLFGLRLKPVVLPDWSSLLKAARDREVDVVLTVAPTAERFDYLAFTLGATPVPGALFARSGTRFDPATALYAVERDYQANDWIRRQYPMARILTVDTTPEALRAVGSGAADLYLGSLLEASDWLSREPVPGVEISRLVGFGTGYYHFGVRKDWAPLAGILNKGIQSLRASTRQELAAVLGGLPASVAAGAELPRLLQLGAADADLLVRRPVWRVGAVRGLTLLNEIDERGLHSGIAAEYTEQVARRLGVAVQLVPFDSVAAMLDGLRGGQIDLVPFLTRTPARSAEFAYSAPYVEMPYMLVARSDAPQYWNLDSLRGRRLALAAQHPLRELLAQRYPDVIIVETGSGTRAMDLVIAGQADAAVEVKLFANLRLNAPDGERLRIVSQVDELPAQFHFATLRSAPELLRLVDLALADIAPAERQRMLRRWVAVDLSPPFPWRRHGPVIVATAVFLLLLAGGTAWWMRRLRREVVARRRSEQLLSDIATNVPGMAFRYVMNEDGSLRHHFFTPGARALLGVDLDPKSTVVASLRERVPEAHRLAVQAAERRSTLTGEPFEVTVPYAHPDGRERWLHARAVRSTGHGGMPVWTGYVVDFTNEHQLQQKLSREAESRSLMLASASHELRAPTHTLSLALQSLSTEGLDEVQQRALQIARDSAHDLAGLLNDVLDAARSGPESLQLRPRDFDLHQLLDDLARAWRTAARTKGLGFELRIAGDVPRLLHTDPLRLKQVLINLLSNACKYTDEGEVRLAATLLKDGPEATLVVEVTDTGPGLSDEQRERLFVPFVTLAEPGSTAPAEGSSGLGLATSRRVAERLGGQVELQGRPGHGTVARLTLPLPAVVRRPAVRGTVLVCDDDDLSRLLLAQMLRRRGFETRETGSSVEALAWWRQGGVSALVTDLDIPGLSGLELIRTLRAEEASTGRRTSVIVCSGSPVPAADAGSATALYDAYLVKPVDLSTLAATFDRLGVAP